jgi:hypothetical protein
MAVDNTSGIGGGLANMKQLYSQGIQQLQSETDAANAFKQKENDIMMASAAVADAEKNTKDTVLRILNG